MIEIISTHVFTLVTKLNSDRIVPCLSHKTYTNKNIMMVMNAKSRAAIVEYTAEEK